MGKGKGGEMNQPEILNTIELLRRYKAQKAYSNSALAQDLTLFGWVWGETLVADLFTGRSRPSPEQTEYLKRYLLMRYYKENLA